MWFLPRFKDVDPDPCLEVNRIQIGAANLGCLPDANDITAFARLRPFTLAGFKGEGRVVAVLAPDTLVLVIELTAEALLQSFPHERGSVFGLMSCDLRGSVFIKVVCELEGIAVSRSDTPTGKATMAIVRDHLSRSGMIVTYELGAMICPSVYQANILVLGNSLSQELIDFRHPVHGSFVTKTTNDKRKRRVSSHAK